MSDQPMYKWETKTSTVISDQSIWLDAVKAALSSPNHKYAHGAMEVADSVVEGFHKRFDKNESEE